VVILVTINLYSPSLNETVLFTPLPRVLFMLLPYLFTTFDDKIARNMHASNKDFSPVFVLQSKPVTEMCSTDQLRTCTYNSEQLVNVVFDSC
jgi:hypothetical protein